MNDKFLAKVDTVEEDKPKVEGAVESKPKPAVKESSPVAKEPLPSSEKPEAKPPAKEPKPDAGEAKPKPKPAATPDAPVAKAPEPAAKPAPKKEPKPEAKAPPKKPAKKPVAPPKKTPPVAPPFKRRWRHVFVMLSFLIMVAVPTAFSAFYLYMRANDQFASHAGFVVRNADQQVGSDFLTSFSGLAGSNGSDADILYEFIRSQELVSLVDRELDLRTIYNKAIDDPYFSLGEDAKIEDLVKYWNRFILVSLDSGTNIMELQVLAFTPEDAQKIAKEVFKQSSIMINGLSEASREDSTRYALLDLENALDRLKGARRNLTNFRSTNQLVDPSVDIQGQMGILNSLNAQLAETTIEMDVIGQNTKAGDVRLAQLKNKIEIIRARVAEERSKIGLGGDVGGSSYSNLVGEYEGLVVEREFAEKNYLNALANLDNAKAVAERQSRYLAAYIKPTLAERAEHPLRLTYAALIALFSFLIWSVLSLILYSLKDRR